MGKVGVGVLQWEYMEGVVMGVNGRENDVWYQGGSCETKDGEGLVGGDCGVKEMLKWESGRVKEVDVEVWVGDGECVFGVPHLAGG